MHNFSRNNRSETYLQTNCPPAQARWDSNELRLQEKAKGWMSPEMIKKEKVLVDTIPGGYPTGNICSYMWLC